MTEENKFVQDQNEQASTTQNFQQEDQASDNERSQDTHSTEYQLQVMQQRLADKDDFINTLKSENQQSREMYSSLEERMKNLNNIEEVLKNRGTQDVANQDTTGLDEDALVGKVIENLNQKQTKQKMDENYSTVLSRLTQEFGEQHVESKVAEAAKANGLTVDDMVNTARKSPEAFYTLTGLKKGQAQSVGTPPPTRGTQMPPQDNGQKDFAYYSQLMRTNPREYWKADTQREFRKLFAKDKN
jgi:hypothetical protein